jgi:hypothetical protein
MKLVELYLSQPGTDLAPLADRPLELIALPEIASVRNLEVLRKMKSLKFIRPPDSKPVPVVDFWRLYDAGEFGKR